MTPDHIVALTPYGAGRIYGSLNDACERAKAEMEGRLYVPDPRIEAEDRIKAWEKTPDGIAHTAQGLELVRLETLILSGEATEEDVCAYCRIKETPPLSEFDRGMLDAGDETVREFIAWVCGRSQREE